MCIVCVHICIAWLNAVVYGKIWYIGPRYNITRLCIGLVQRHNFISYVGTCHPDKIACLNPVWIFKIIQWRYRWIFTRVLFVDKGWYLFAKVFPKPMCLWKQMWALRQVWLRTVNCFVSIISTIVFVFNKILRISNIVCDRQCWLW